MDSKDLMGLQSNLKSFKGMFTRQKKQKQKLKKKTHQLKFTNMHECNLKPVHDDV